MITIYIDATLLAPPPRHWDCNKSDDYVSFHMYSLYNSKFLFKIGDMYKIRVFFDRELVFVEDQMRLMSTNDYDSFTFEKRTEWITDLGNAKLP